MFRRRFLVAILAVTVITARVLIAADSTRAVPQAGWHVRLRDDATLNAAWVGAGEALWAVGDSGVILASNDNGETWHLQESHTSARLLDIQFLDAQHGWIVGGWAEPDSRVSRGLVLVTRDGGRSWQQVPVDLPRLCALSFESPTRGWVAGDWSAAHKTSWFETSDGGRTWQPAVGGEVGPVVAAAATADAEIALLRSGVAVRRAGPRGAFQPLVGDQTLRGVAAASAAVALVGAHRVAIKAGGAPVQFEAPDSEERGFDLCCVAFQRDRLWASGLCGGTLWFQQAGRWSAVPTGLVGKVNDIHGTADGRIVAVGSFGQILISHDFGNRWRRVRGEDRGVAAMVVADSPDGMPLGTVARLAGRDAARVVMACTRQPAPDDPLAIDVEEAMREAALAVGASEYVSLTGHATAEQARSAATHGQPAEASVLNALRSYRPRVVLLAADLDEETKKHWRNGCRTLSHTPLVVEQTSGSVGSIVVHPHAAVPALGSTISALVAEARARVSPEYTPSERETWAVTGLAGLSAGGEDLLPAGVRLDRSVLRGEPGGSKRYLGMLQARTKYPQLVDNLFSTAGSDDASSYAAKLSSLVDKLPEEHHDEILRLALAAASTQDLHRHWRATIDLASRRRRGSGLGRRALLESRAIEHSSEWRSMAAEPAGVAVASFTSPTASTAPRSPFAHRDRQREGALRQPDLVQPQVSEPPAPEPEDLDLLFREHPAQLFASPQAAAVQWQLLRSSKSAGPWARLAAARLPNVDVPGEATDIRFADARPALDGHLEESIWQPLASSAAVPREVGSEPGIALAYDSEFLFIAARFQAADEDEPTAARVRDAALDDAQRVVIQLDTDADLLTSFRLEIDAAGQTRDTCDGFLSWQPRWYVATAHDDEGWVTVEAAVHRASLVDLPPVPGERWLVRASVQEAGDSMPVGPDWRPEGWRVAVFR